jgi:hypothetical protein
VIPEAAASVPAFDRRPETAATETAYTSGMDLDLVVVYRARNELMANSIRDLLAQEGIPAVLSNFRSIANSPEHNRTNVYGNNFGAWGEVLVQRAQADQAVDLIEGFTTGGAALSDGELEALALSAESPEAEPFASPSTELDDDKRKSSFPAWLRSTFRFLSVLVAGPPADQHS